jgi:hypothetical protein
MNTQYSKQWIAGFFDGEGSVSISRRKRGNFIEHHMSVQIGQNDRECLDGIANIYGGTIHQSGCWRWRCHGTVLERFLKDILPYSIVKRDQIEVALKMRKLIGKPGRRMSDSVFRKKEALWHEMQRIKGKE